MYVFVCGRCAFVFVELCVCDDGADVFSGVDSVSLWSDQMVFTGWGVDMAELGELEVDIAITWLPCAKKVTEGETVRECVARKSH